MSYWIVKQEIESLDLPSYADATKSLRSKLEDEIGQLYRTRCTLCGLDSAHMKYALWVKVIPCKKCGEDVELYPGYLLSTNARHPTTVCGSSCGELQRPATDGHPVAVATCAEN